MMSLKVGDSAVLAAVLVTFSAQQIDALPLALEQTFDNPTPSGVDLFGVSVSLSSDGNTALIGASGDDTGATSSGAAYLFDVGTNTLLKTLVNPAPAFQD